MSRFELDNVRLAAYLEQHVDGLRGPITSSKFEGGQSNPTYKIEAQNASYVLRRKPPGKLLRGAHQVDREFRILSALKDSEVPVARTFHLCEDDNIIGSMFYLMEFVEGRVLWDPALPECSKEERTEIYDQMNLVLANLHSVDINEVGLQDYGKHGGYFTRQTNTWTKQYRASELQKIDDMEYLIKWLPENQPEDDGKVSIVHGDYRLDNLMFDKNVPKIIATLDWELSTLGHPYADLAYQCMQYYMPRVGGVAGLAGLNYAELGIPTETEYRDQYCERMGLGEIPNWNYYLTFSLFRLAAICQGVVKRGHDGNASSNKAATYAAMVTKLADLAVNISKR